LVFFLFPRKEREEEMLAQFHAEDVGAAEPEVAQAPPVLH
jgi:hypothetical protein